MMVSEIEYIETYISSRKNAVAQYIAMHHILYLCMEVDRRSGSRVPKRWLDQEFQVFPGVQAAGKEGGTVLGKYMG